MADIDLMRFARHRDETEAMARRRGWDIPTEYHQLRGIARAAHGIATEPIPNDPQPTKIAEVPRWVDRQATARVRHGEQVKVAAELAEVHETASIRAILKMVPGDYIPKLCAEFDKAVETFAGLMSSAPGAVTSSTTPDDAARHVQLLASVDALTIAAADRVTLAVASGELIDLDHNSSWLWFDPHGYIGVHQAIEFLSEHRAPPADLDGWRRAIGVGVGLAGYDEAAIRRDRFNAARFSSGQQSHGGQRDTLLSVAYQLAESRSQPPRALAAST